MPGPTRTRAKRVTVNDAILIIRIPEQLREEAAREAAKWGISLSEAVRQSIEWWLDDMQSPDKSNV